MKKPSSSTVGGSIGTRRKHSFGTGSHNRCRTCPQCFLDIEDEIEFCEENDIVRVDRKGKARSNSHPEISGPLPLGYSVTVGRPAVQRSASSPAAVHARLRTTSSAGSRTTAPSPSPAEVLARSSYNHQWPAAELTSHIRSSSDPNNLPKAATVGHSAAPWTKRCRYSHLNDVRDVLRGVQMGIRPSTPLPGMPNSSPSRSRPPPTSYRPVSRLAGHSRSPSPSPSTMSTQRQVYFPSAGLSRSLSQDASFAPSVVCGARTRKRAHSLENLTDSARSLALATTSPIRSLMRHSQIRKAQHAQGAGSAGSDDESGIWICVDVKAPVGVPDADNACAHRPVGV